jgi:hypothetical protein
MTKGEIRKARKSARGSGQRFSGDLALSADDVGSQNFSESARGYRARERWARRYEQMDGAPEGDSDR